MKKFILAICVCLFMGGATEFVRTLRADPCGMVPPIYAGNVAPINRIGLQKTFVFYKDGVETFVIRPGFEGNVEEFGMLIPFPTPPEIRKVADNTFEHVVNAIDPPEVVVDLRVPGSATKRFAGAVEFDRAVQQNGLEYKKNKVTVLKEEAVGMYEVAVLEAGSPEALKRWMDQHGYQYPKGMDAVTKDYVELGWCFVAVKTKVGDKAGVDPKPGQRETAADRPPGSVFDGHVQGMGFRFKSDEFVVPMRLSAFNGGDTRNVVYILSDSPRRIRSIPEEYVQRQISGQDLIRNVSNPLPLRIIGGTEKDIPEWQRKGLDERRNPTAKNGIAKELFAADLLAVETGNLSLEHEEEEKELLRIGEHFGLRGAEVDSENALTLQKMRDETTEKGLELLAGMTLSVVDGDFPREVLANQNLTFADYKMPVARNKAESYDSKLFGPGQEKEGKVFLGSIDWNEVDQQIARSEAESKLELAAARKNRLTGWAWIVSLASIGMVLTISFRRRTAAIAVVIACLACSSTIAGELQNETGPSLEQIIAQLKDGKTAAGAIQAAAEMAQDSSQRGNVVANLLNVIQNGDDIPQKGWAIAAMAEIGGSDVDEILLNIHANESNEKLIRTWAAAARVSMTKSVNGLIEKAQLIQTFPALGRPIGIRIVEEMNKDGAEVNPEKMIQATLRVPQLVQGLAPAIIAFGPEKLVSVVYESSDNNIRRTGAGYLGTLAQAGQGTDVSNAVIAAVEFDPQATDVPWAGGALFIPNIQWDKDNSRALVGNLIRWHVWCDMNNKGEEQNQIHNNIRSVALIQAAGYANPGWNNVGTVQWLQSWKQAVGNDGIRELLTDVGALENRKYAAVLD